MKLSEIVAYLNLLDRHDPDIECRDTMRRFEGVYHVVRNHPIQLDTFSAKLGKVCTDIENSMREFTDNVLSLRQQLELERDHLEPEYLRESRRWFDHEQPFENNHYILNRRLVADDDSNILIRSHLRNYSDWRLPGMILRPGKDTFIEDLVPLDPLYLVDHHQELLDHSIRNFNPEYQRRLRPYIIDDRGNGPVMDKLPNDQFGFVFAYNFFNYKPLDLISKYLDELYQKLRPGGVVLMTFNNCDRAQGAGLAERNFMCYTPRRYILAHAESLGFDCIFMHDGQGDLSWVEFRKPGNITSLRGGQTLAKIVALPN
jgi:SAM-dependent methyltransferase